MHGESGSANVAAINLKFPNIISTTSQYSLCDIYNIDKTGLFYTMAPNHTIVSRQIEKSKKDCMRLTIAFTTNADGTHKLQSFIIRHSARPRCFKKKTEWIEKLDKEMKESNYYILLVLDGAPSHVTSALNLNNVKVLTLPPYITSKIQPMDTGVIASFKLHYHYIQLQHAIDHNKAEEKDIYKID
ncbi:1905_t:CDS:2 [Dentiscutata heterogama]|uniref:1905_t:CDS:1 n=1 Tax=Dentiscutata heterogama TaxID=1316150 RepID=A0ACA9P096_9GLOM|nr:1905_t:CDS:2 [Dentiscutata heterogama]